MAATGATLGTGAGVAAVAVTGAEGMTAVGAVAAGTATGAGIGALTTVGVIGGIAAVGAVGAVIATGGVAAIPMIISGWSSFFLGTATAGGVMGAEIEGYTNAFDGNSFFSENMELSPIVDVSSYEWI